MQMIESFFVLFPYNTCVLKIQNIVLVQTKRHSPTYTRKNCIIFKIRNNLNVIIKAYLGRPLF